MKLARVALLLIIIRSVCITIGQLYDFWRAYSLFVARVASLALERSEFANDATWRENS